MDLYGDFYSPVKLLSYGRRLNISIGSRSIGKSTGIGMHLLKDFIENGHRFIYMRRTKDETDDTAPNYFGDAVSILNDNGFSINDFSYINNKYFLNGELCGYSLSLRRQSKAKSMGISNVWWILYDEFMITPGESSFYLGGRNNMTREVDAMASLIQTVDRKKGKAFRNEVRVFLVGNAGTLYNPFLMNFDIDAMLRPETKYLAPKKEDYVVEMTDQVEATKDFKNSFGYYMSSKKVKAYAYENKFYDTLGAEAFILKKPDGPRSPLLTFEYDGENYGVYGYERAGYLYVSHEPTNRGKVLALTAQDHKPNYLMFENYRGHPGLVLIKDMYDKGAIRFFDLKCKSVIDFYLKYAI